MNPTYNPSVGYHSGGCTIEGGLNPDTIVTVGLVPASQHGDSHAMEVGGPAFREYHSITPGTGAMTNSQSGPSTSRLTLMTHVDPEDMERRNAISMPTSSSTFQGVSCGVTENAGMIRSHAGRGLPAEEFEDNISKLTDRLISQGVDRAVVELCSAIFAQGVSLEALKARMTRDECEKHGLRSGMRYRMLLDVVKMMKTGVLVDRHVCRLCRRHEAADYKHHRDALRHLLRDHFGMGFQCTQWSAFLFAARSGHHSHASQQQTDILDCERAQQTRCSKASRCKEQVRHLPKQQLVHRIHRLLAHGPQLTYTIPLRLMDCVIC